MKYTQSIPELRLVYISIHHSFGSHKLPKSKNSKKRIKRTLRFLKERKRTMRSEQKRMQCPTLTSCTNNVRKGNFSDLHDVTRILQCQPVGRWWATFFRHCWATFVGHCLATFEGHCWATFEGHCWATFEGHCLATFLGRRRKRQAMALHFSSEYTGIIVIYFYKCIY